MINPLLRGARRTDRRSPPGQYRTVGWMAPLKACSHLPAHATGPETIPTHVVCRYSFLPSFLPSLLFFPGCV